MGLRNIWIKIKGKDDSKAAMRSATDGVDRLGRRSVSLGKIFKTSFGIAMKAVKLMTGAITATVLASAGMVKVGFNFRKAMALVNTMLPDGSKNMRAFGNDVIDLSMQLGIAKDQLASGLYQTLSAGVPENNAISFLATAAKAAVGGATDVATAVDALTTVVNSYAADGVTATQASDVLFATVKQGKTTFEELATQIGQVAGIAANSSIPLESMAAAIATITKSGINTRRAITGLRAGILSIVAPSDELAKKLDKLGISGEELIKTKGVQGAFAEIAKLAGGSQEALKKLIPQVEALPAFLALAGTNAKTAAADLKTVGNALGKAEKAFNKMDDVRGWPGLWQSISGQITKIGVTMDEKLNPTARKIGTAIQKWGESEQFKGILTTLDIALTKAIKVGEALGAGGESRAAAQDYIKSLTQPLVDALVSGGERIGEAILRGMFKAGLKAPAAILRAREVTGEAIRKMVTERTGNGAAGVGAEQAFNAVQPLAPIAAMRHAYERLTRKKPTDTAGGFDRMSNLLGRSRLPSSSQGATISRMADAAERSAKATEGMREDLKK